MDIVMLTNNILNMRHLSIWGKKMSLNAVQMKNQLQALGIVLDINSGNILYAKDFAPLRLNCDIVFVRHGVTFGNCGQSTVNGTINYNAVKSSIKDNEKRIYQGNVDTEINQLSAEGIKQAEEAAHKLQSELLDQGWIPDVILLSPLKRAKDTALPFVKANHFENRCVIHQGIREMSFGSWDNRRVCDISPTNSCHLFY